MRIGFFTDDYLPRASGVVSSLLSLRKGLIELGHEVYIIAPRHPSVTAPDEYTIFIPSASPPLFQDMRAALPQKKYIRKICELKLDVVHSMTQYNTGILADYIAKKTNVPHVTMMNTIVPELLSFYPGKTAVGYMYCSALYSFYFGERARISWPAVDELMSPKRSSVKVMKRQIWNMINIFLDNTDHIFVPSIYMQTYLKINGTNTPSSVTHNSLDTSFYDKPRTRSFMEGEKLQIVCVGRLSREKRQDCLIKALARTKRTELSIIGDGPTLGDLRWLAKKLSLQDKVTFHGAQDQTFIRDELLKSDISALVSFNFDSQGMVLQEAAASGLPVLYCDPKLTENAAGGSILSGHTISHLASTLQQLEHGAYDLEKMGAQAKKFAGRFDYKIIANQTADTYNSLTSASK